MTYRNYTITPCEFGGVVYVHDDYDGPTGEPKCGWAETEEEARAEIDDIEATVRTQRPADEYDKTPEWSGIHSEENQ